MKQISSLYVSGIGTSKEELQTSKKNIAGVKVQIRVSRGQSEVILFGNALYRENMQFKQVKKEIFYYIKRDFVQNCRFYAKRGDFLQIKRNIV